MKKLALESHFAPNLKGIYIPCNFAWVMFNKMGAQSDSRIGRFLMCLWSVNGN